MSYIPKTLLMLATATTSPDRKSLPTETLAVTERRPCTIDAMIARRLGRSVTHDTGYAAAARGGGSSSASRRWRDGSVSVARGQRSKGRALRRSTRVRRGENRDRAQRKVGVLRRRHSQGQERSGVGDGRFERHNAADSTSGCGRDSRDFAPREKRPGRWRRLARRMRRSTTVQQGSGAMIPVRSDAVRIQVQRLRHPTREAKSCLVRTAGEAPLV